MKMTDEQKVAYKAYRKECRISNVEPVRADFLAGDIPSCIDIEWRLQIEAAKKTKTNLKAKAATAGR
ncbi:MAG TPA: hypothetical protein VNO32_26700 [Candidatus Acidoferrum sp.]|nr:hypothetical protein [Candidatus Acidoferrum sp.]